VNHAAVAQNSVMNLNDHAARSDRPHILVCIPAYNEAKTIKDVVRKAKKYAQYVIVYDDGSSDETYIIAKSSGADQVIRSTENKGYGVAIRALFQAAREKDADLMVTLDSDGQHDPDQIPDLIKPICEEGFDITIGSRFLRSEDKVGIPSYRSFGIRAITRLANYASYRDITDAQSGFRAYNNKAITSINLFEEGMAVSTEILSRAQERHLLIKEVPVTVRYNTSNHTSTHHPITHGIAVIYSLVQFISLRHPLAFYGLPGLTLLIISAIFISNALDLFAETRYVSVPMILISVGASVIGVVLLATGAILYTMIALLKGKIRTDI
jgi:glycosyltransferase involved in cell wall biosynthesis